MLRSLAAGSASEPIRPHWLSKYVICLDPTWSTTPKVPFPTSPCAPPKPKAKAKRISVGSIPMHPGWQIGKPGGTTRTDAARGRWAAWFASDAIRIHGAILEVDGIGAVIAPEPAWARLVPHERTLAQDGIRLIARDGVLDPCGEVVVPPTRVHPTLTAGSANPLANLDQEVRRALRGWLLETGKQAGLAIAPGRGTMLAQAAIVNASLLDPQETLKGLTRVLESIPLVTYIGEWRSIAENVRACVTRV